MSLVPLFLSVRAQLSALCCMDTQLRISGMKRAVVLRMPSKEPQTRRHWTRLRNQPMCHQGRQRHLGMERWPQQVQAQHLALVTPWAALVDHVAGPQQMRTATPKRGDSQRTLKTNAPSHDQLLNNRFPRRITPSSFIGGLEMKGTGRGLEQDCMLPKSASEMGLEVTESTTHPDQPLGGISALLECYLLFSYPTNGKQQTT